MNYINKIIASGIIGLTLSGCVAPKTYYTGGVRVESKDYARPSVIMQPQIDKINKKPSSLDDFMSNLKKQSNQLEAKVCFNQYESHINGINRDVNNKKYSSVNNKVLNLINYTEKKSDKCSRDINNSLKNFTYRKYEYVDAKYRVTEKLSNDPFEIVLNVVSTAVGILEVPFGRRPDFNQLNSVKKNKSEVEKAHYKIYEINPYRRTERFIGLQQIN
jgi:hypothetical protein